MHFLEILGLCTLVSLPYVSSTTSSATSSTTSSDTPSAAFFNIEVLTQGRSFSHYVDYQGMVNKKARFSKEPDVFVLRDGRLSDMHTEDNRGITKVADLVIGFENQDKQAFKITTGWMKMPPPIMETFSIDDQGFLQWHSDALFWSQWNQEGKAVWCREDDLLVARSEPVGSQCKGVSLKVKMVDGNVGAGKTEL